MKRVLQCSLQAPPAHGVMSLRYARIVEPLRDLEWEMHHLGPDPRIDSAVELLPFPTPCLGRYSRHIGWARRSSVARARSTGAVHLAWSALRGAFVLAQRAGLPDHSRERLIADLVAIGGEYLKSEGPFDLLLAAPSSLSFGEAMADLAEETGLPLALNFHDPVGERDGSGLRPAEPERQARLLARAAGIGFASPLTARWYAEHFPEIRARQTVLSDSYRSLIANEASVAATARPGPGALRFIHAGGLTGYRPVGPFVEALAAFVAEQDEIVELSCVGFVDAANLELLRAIARLRFTARREAPYRETRMLLAAADILVALIGPRHLDNVPSKFFEYLAYGKPILVLGPPGNPLEELLAELGVGVFRDVSKPPEILDGLVAVTRNAGAFRQAFESNRHRIGRYESSQTARAWATFFDECARASGLRERQPPLAAG